ncbi:MAG TPA: hypothetical protein VFA39_18455 [Steroidobacteraceae bacterium]|nr:hypothetical protein [Steroidobacteraceae bacterium]
MIVDLVLKARITFRIGARLGIAAGAPTTRTAVLANSLLIRALSRSSASCCCTGSTVGVAGGLLSGFQNGPSQIARQRRAKLRDVGVIPRHAHKAVGRGGRICMGKLKINLSQAFAGQKVGVKQIEAGSAGELYAVPPRVF